MKTVTGLIQKDLLTIRTYLYRQIGLLLIIYLVLGWAIKSMSMLPAMVMMGMVMGLLSTFSFDESCHWNAFACTMGVPPSRLVLARYLLFYGSMVICAVVTTVLSVGLDFLLFSDQQDQLEILFAGMGGSAAILVIYTLMCAVDFPMFYKLGMERSRLPMTLTFVIPFIVIFPTMSYWGPWLESLDLAAVPWGLVAVCTAALLVLVAVVSYRISVRIVQNKEW